MAVRVEMDIVGMTRERYERSAQALEGIVQEQPGFIFHCSGVTERGVFVTEVWESQEAFERYAQATVIPVAQEQGWPQIEPRYEQTGIVVTSGT